jgi:hypothetical protein
MSKLQFEWDGAKAASNFAKHGIRFQSATRLFLDPDAIDVDATRVGDDEARRKIIGVVDGRLLTAVNTLRGNVRRLISARRANRKEERSWFDLS